MNQTKSISLKEKGWTKFSSVSTDSELISVASNIGNILKHPNRLMVFTLKRFTFFIEYARLNGTFAGMISVGLAELQEYHLVVRCKVPTPIAVGTSVFVVVITVLVASVSHFYAFAQEGSEVVNVIIFTIPGVVIGGQIGPKLQKIIPEDKMKVAISIAFVMIGIFMLYTITQ